MPLLLPEKTFFHICIEIVKFSGELGVPEKKTSKPAKNYQLNCVTYLPRLDEPWIQQSWQSY